MEGVAKTGRPPWARYVWFDAEALYMEMPVKGAPPIIMKFDFSDGGLDKCRKTMKVVYDKAGPHRERNGWSLDHPIIKREREGQKAKPKMTTESRSIARTILKKLGMIG